MNTREIEGLLEKFYEGNTSLQDEKILRDFFQKDDVPAHLKSHQALFAYYGDEQGQELGSRDFEQKLTAQFMDHSTETNVVPMHPLRSRLLFISSIAAGILLIIGLFFTIQNDVFKRSITHKGNPDPGIAYADASAALLLVSGNLNNGMKQVEKLQMVDKAMKNMQLFNKFYQYQTIITNPDGILSQSLNSKQP